MLIAPRRAACFSSLNSVLLKYEKCNTKKGRRRKRRGAGRPATGSNPSRTFRLSDEFMASLDARSTRQDDAPSRTEAIRRLVELGLKARK